MMMEWLSYLLKVSACLTLFFAFYLVFLRKLTFFKINRFYLLSALLLSFVIPAINVQIERIAPVVVDHVQPQQIQIGQMVQQNTTQAVVEQGFNWSFLLAIIYGIAVASLLLLAAWRLFQLLKHTAGHTHRVNGLKLVPKSTGFTNCSFLNYVFIDQQNLSEQELTFLLRHEEVHAKQYHSLDKLVLTIIKAVLWFNPVIYFYDKALEQMHEYEADESTSADMGTQCYANLLLRLATQDHQMPMVHNFVKSPIKERIKMLYQSKSKNMKKMSYVLALPIATILVWGFAVNVVYAQSKVEEVKTAKVVVEKVVGTGQVVEVRSLKQPTVSTKGHLLAESVKRKDVSGTSVNPSNVVVESIRATTVNNIITTKGHQTAIGGGNEKLSSVTISANPAVAGREVVSVVGTPMAAIDGSKNNVSVSGMVKARNNQVSEVRVTSLANIKKEAGLYISKEKIALIIDESTTKQQLDEYKAKLKEKNIDFKINQVKLGADNKVTYIDFSVDCNDGFKGAVSGTPKTNGSIGFYRSYHKNSSPFGTGSIEEN